MVYYSYDNKRGNKGPTVVLIIVLFCIANALWYYALHIDDPESKPIKEFVNNIFDVDSNVVEGEASNDPITNNDTRPVLKGGCYYYQQLSESEKSVYEDIYNACENLLPATRITPTNRFGAERAIYAIRSDHPEFYWLKDDVVHTKMINDVAVEFSCSVPSDASEKLKILDNKANEILANAPSDKYGKVKYIYEYIINTTDYDLNAQDNQSPYSALVNGSSVCGGYAGAFQYLCDKAGIYCGFVSGEIRGRGLHAWNFVRINGQFYWVDVTWGDPVFADGSPGTDNLNYDYLCVEDSEFLPERILPSDPSYSEHEIFMGFDYPNCVDNSLNYYRQMGCYFDTYDRRAVYEYIMNRVATYGSDKITLKFANTEYYQQATSEIFTSEYLQELANDLRARYGITIRRQTGKVYDKSHRMEVAFELA